MSAITDEEHMRRETQHAREHRAAAAQHPQAWTIPREDQR